MNLAEVLIDVLPRNWRVFCNLFAHDKPRIPRYGTAGASTRSRRVEDR